ncbi:MAG: D-alanine--D-alanine ligase family protein [Micrococcaceae bacterium]
MVNVVVLFGGQSSEHAVSCVTATNVVENLKAEGFNVYPVGITKDGYWTYVPTEDVNFQFSSDSGTLPEIKKGQWHVNLPEDTLSTTWTLSDGKQSKTLADIDVVFPLLHGPYGEDGTVQGMLELLHIRYVGSGVLASAAAMEKHTTKVLAQAAGIEVAPWVFISERSWRLHKAEILQECKKLPLPLFVKPSRAGSSVGVTKIKSYDELEAAIEEARKHDPKVLVEQAIVGQEIECSVLDGYPAPKASYPAEIKMSTGVEFYDYDAKYINSEDSHVECPAQISEEATEQIQQLALRAFDVLDLEGLARVDFFYTADGTFVLNEINTLPGFTGISGYPLMWKVSGIPYGKLLATLVELAMDRPVGLR